jgi:hypothetical protein
MKNRSFTKKITNPLLGNGETPFWEKPNVQRGPELHPLIQYGEDEPLALLG